MYGATLNREIINQYYADLSPEEIERICSNYEKYTALEEQKNNNYSNEQEAFLEQKLPEMIESFAAELENIKDSIWEETSFEKSIKLILEIEKDYHRLNSIGLQVLFKTNFCYIMSTGLDLLFRKITTMREQLQASFNGTLSTYENQQLENFFHLSQTRNIRVEDKRKALDFMKFIRQESMK